MFIFVTPPSLEELATRLRQRHTETETDLDLRLKTARRELETLPMFDYVVLNRQGELEKAAADIQAIITAEKCRVEPREIIL